MTRTAYTLDDLGGALSPRALLSFVRGLPAESLTWRETHPGRAAEGEWSDVALVPQLLASAVDALNAISWQLGGGRGPRPRPIPRPGVDGGERVIGSDPIPVRDFDAWWEGDG